MTTKLKLFLLDADVIITIHEHGIWEKLVAAADVAVAATVVHDEALFFSKKIGGIPEAINLPRLAGEGRIVELSASSEEIRRVRGFFKPGTHMSLHDGEIETLTLLASHSAADRKFCTGDKAAIQALAMLGFSSEGVSLEAVLGFTGLQRALRHCYSDDYFKQYIRIGQERRMHGEGIPY